MVTSPLAAGHTSGSSASAPESNASASPLPGEPGSIAPSEHAPTSDAAQTNMSQRANMFERNLPSVRGRPQHGLGTCAVAPGDRRDKERAQITPRKGSALSSEPKRASAVAAGPTDDFPGTVVAVLVGVENAPALAQRLRVTG